MLRDLENYSTYNEVKWKEIRLFNESDAIHKLNPEKYDILMKAWSELLQFGDVIEFIRITYRNAWIDNPFDKDFIIEIDDTHD